eukprot:1348998-Amorphochlora_amoeboformis.AAC.2
MVLVLAFRIYDSYSQHSMRNFIGKRKYTFTRSKNRHKTPLGYPLRRVLAPGDPTLKSVLPNLNSNSGRTYGVSPGDTIWFVKNRLGFSVERLSLNEAFQRDQSPTPEPEDIVDQSVAPSREPSIPTSAPQSPPIETSSEDQVGADGITTAFDSQMDIAQDVKTH